MITKRLLGGVAMLAAMFAAPAANAQSDVESFYARTQIRLVSTAGPGSGFTVWAHFISQHLGKFIPGNPKIVVESMGGAGGLIGTNWAYVVAPKDGSVILSIPRQAPILSTMKAKGVQYDAAKFTWLGSPTTDVSICISEKNGPWKSLPDYYAKELLVGADGVGSGTHMYPVALKTILGMQFKVIDGYSDSGAALLAIDKGELHGSCQSADTLMQQRGQQISSGDWKIVLQAGLKPDPNLPNVPFVMDIAKTEEQKQALAFLFSAMTLGRPFVVAPGVPEARTAALRKAFGDMFKDPDFLREAKARKYEINPIYGDEMTKIVEEVAQTPKNIVTQVAEIIEPPK